MNRFFCSLIGLFLCLCGYAQQANLYIYGKWDPQFKYWTYAEQYSLHSIDLLEFIGNTPYKSELKEIYDNKNNLKGGIYAIQSVANPNLFLNILPFEYNPKGLQYGRCFISNNIQLFSVGKFRDEEGGYDVHVWNSSKIPSLNYNKYNGKEFEARLEFFKKGDAFCLYYDKPFFTYRNAFPPGDKKSRVLSIANANAVNPQEVEIQITTKVNDYQKWRLLPVYNNERDEIVQREVNREIAEQKRIIQEEQERIEKAEQERERERAEAIAEFKNLIQSRWVGKIDGDITYLNITPMKKYQTEQDYYRLKFSTSIDEGIAKGFTVKNSSIILYFQDNSGRLSGLPISQYYQVEINTKTKVLYYSLITEGLRGHSVAGPFRFEKK